MNDFEKRMRARADKVSDHASKELLIALLHGLIGSVITDKTMRGSSLFPEEMKGEARKNVILAIDTITPIIDQLYRDSDKQDDSKA